MNIPGAPAPSDLQAVATTRKMPCSRALTALCRTALKTAHSSATASSLPSTSSGPETCCSAASLIAAKSSDGVIDSSEKSPPSSFSCVKLSIMPCAWSGTLGRSCSSKSSLNLSCTKLPRAPSALSAKAVVPSSSAASSIPSKFPIHLRPVYQPQRLLEQL